MAASNGFSMHGIARAARPVSAPASTNAPSETHGTYCVLCGAALTTAWVPSQLVALLVRTGAHEDRREFRVHVPAGLLLCREHQWCRMDRSDTWARWLGDAGEADAIAARLQASGCRVVEIGAETKQSATSRAKYGGRRTIQTWAVTIGSLSR